MSRTTRDISSIMGTGHFLMNLATYQGADLNILGVDIDARGNLTFFVDVDHHDQLNDLFVPVAIDSRKITKQTVKREGYDLIIFERHFYIMDVSVITSSCVRSHQTDYTGGEG